MPIFAISTAIIVDMQEATAAASNSQGVVKGPVPANDPNM
jgi:hypothetical protein